MRKELFRGLYVAHSRQVFSYLLGRTSDKDTAADLLQDIFLKVWNRIEVVERIPDEERLYWIFSIASNRLTDYYRRASSEKNMEEKLRSRNDYSTGDLSGLLAGREQFRELESHINQLPEELRSILLMKVIGGMNSSQIGNALNQPPGTIRYKMGMARRQLAEKLELLETESIGGRRKPIG
jgi:RNA polymerase sigma-70 factor (ECF subfamily)